MEEPRSAANRSSSSGGFEATPLLRTLLNGGPIANTNPNNNNNIALFISRATSRRIMREPSMLVRETAALQLEERQSGWSYSKPIVILDIIWNLAFVIVSAVVLLSTIRERPSTPLRVWVIGYSLQCIFHVCFVYVEYRRRNRTLRTGSGSGHDANDSDGEDQEGSVNRSSIPKRLESMNTMASFLWWILGFYWIVVGGQALLQDAPCLYWLAVVFLAFDVFFAIFCVALACIIGVALCCCLPCIIAILYAVAGQEGASDADISGLPRFRYRLIKKLEKFDSDKMEAVAGTSMETSIGNSIGELALSPEDSECCICLSSYEDGAELHSLPCSHHFHCGCIIKWLRINATCPLCKYNILDRSEQV